MTRYGIDRRPALPLPSYMAHKHTHLCPTCMRWIACYCVTREPDSPKECGSGRNVCRPPAPKEHV